MIHLQFRLIAIDEIADRTVGTGLVEHLDMNETENPLR